jgi:hypothetical protein
MERRYMGVVGWCFEGGMTSGVVDSGGDDHGPESSPAVHVGR